jgi:hypothetical protein
LWWLAAYRLNSALSGETITDDTGYVCCGEGERDELAPDGCCYDQDEYDDLEDALEYSDGPDGWPAVLQGSLMLDELVDECGVFSSDVASTRNWQPRG